jgi:Alkylmercury lyase
MSTDTKTRSSFDQQLRLFVYRHMIRHEKCPTVKQLAKELASSSARVRAALARLSESHAFMLQENGELWRAAPFSSIPTAFPVTVGRKSWFGNCIWDALGIPAMLGKDAMIGAACGCCNYDMPVEIRKGKLRPAEGIIHIAVPAREWYKDVVFT